MLYSQEWVYKVTGSALGNPLAYNPLNTNILYGSVGNNRIQISRNGGYTWQQLGNNVYTSGIIKSIDINPLDTLQILVGLELGNGTPDKIMKTTDGGTTWFETWNGSFSYYGRPIEFKAVHPDTVYTMGSDTLWRSIDFGTTWNVVTKVSGFNTWCDAEIRPDSANIIYIGDNLSGIWKTTDHGVTWKKVYSTSGEIPSIAIDPFNPQVAYATKYGGGGGVVKTSNGGETWYPLTTPVGSGSTWWITTSPVRPNYVYFGTFGPSPPLNGPYLSRNGGASWQRIATAMEPGPDFNVINFGLLAVDTLTVLALQANGIWKLQYPTGIRVQSPNGGEYWDVGSLRTITWRDSGLTSGVRIEFSADSGVTWLTLANGISPDVQAYEWIIPDIPSSTCLVRVCDTLTTTFCDTSNSVFSIYYPSLSLTSPNGGETWKAGSVKKITWLSSGSSRIIIEYSVDNGTTWDTIAEVAASAYSYDWVVPYVSTTQAKIGLRDNYFNFFEESDSAFTIYIEPEFSVAVVVTDNGFEHDTLRFGVLAGATDSIDTSLGEVELTAKPPLGTFDARWRVLETNGTMLDLRDSLSDLNPYNTFIGELQPGMGGYPMTLYWNPENLGSGGFFLRDVETQGSAFLVDMKRESTLVITDTSIHAFEIHQCRDITMTIEGRVGWSLISLPVQVSDNRKEKVYPYSNSSAYEYDLGYREASIIEYGKGYWLKTGPMTLNGCPLLLDTFNVKSGWNIIGSISDTFAVSAIQTIPETLIVSDFYGFDNGYFVASDIVPGNGYWVKVNQNGKLIFQSGFSKKVLSNIASTYFDKLNWLNISDGRGKGQTLYFGVTTDEPDKHSELPPVPPDEAFDARFSSNSNVTLHPKNIENERIYEILVRGVRGNIILTWKVENFKNFSYILLRTGREGEREAIPLEGSGFIQLKNSEHVSFALAVQSSKEQQKLPTAFSLEQNFPNPFNPSTRLRYTVPVDAHVRLTVYSSIGEEVALLCDETQQAGTYSVTWDGKNKEGRDVSSGVYFVRFYASSTKRVFTDTRKLVLMK